MIDADIEELAAINEQKASRNAEIARHNESQLSALDTQEIILRAFKSLIDYMEGTISKSEVVNFPDSMRTPDIAHVVRSVNALHETLLTHKNTDLTEITEVMKRVLEQAEKLPKELPDVPEQQFVDYTEYFSKLEKAVDAVTEAVSNQKTTVEAPQVHVPAPNVHVEAPDMQPVSTGLEKLHKVLKSLVFPEYKTDNKEVEKLLKRANKTLDGILDKPTGGGGGGGRATPYGDADGMPAFVTLDDGAVPVTTSKKTERFDYSGNPIYVGSAPLGSDESDSVWYIEMFDLSDSSNALGKKAVEASWTDRALAVYT